MCYEEYIPSIAYDYYNLLMYVLLYHNYTMISLIEYTNFDLETTFLLNDQAIYIVH